MNINILEIDQKIKEKFTKEISQLQLYENELKKNKEILCCVDKISNSTKIGLTKKCEELNSKIEDIENSKILNYYILDTIDLLESYKNIINKPKKISFFGKCPESSGEKEKIEEKYLEIVKKYIDLEILKNIKPITPPPKNIKLCENCGNKKDFHIIENRIYICENCGNQTENIGTTTSYSDVSRVNISSKYTYERKIHFRDCINQYQGKQNSTINEKVYKDLTEQFELHGLLIKNAVGKDRFKNITKNHILLFLKELGYTKHYEDVFLIHYKLTDKKPDDITHLEQKLMEDFNTLSTLYDQKFKQTKRVERKNFINTQYVLYQLLRKYKHPCKKEDFNILKTLDRKSFHDEICVELFTDLGWNFTPFF